MAGELQIDPSGSLELWKFLSVVIFYFFIFLFLEIYSFKNRKYALAIWGIWGFVLALINYFLFGYLGLIFVLLIKPFFSCSSAFDSCWFWLYHAGSGGLLLSGILIGLLFQKIISHKKKE